MHLIRLLISGIHVLETGQVAVRMDEHRDELLSIKSGQRKWEEVNQWRMDLQRKFDQAFQTTTLPESPNYDVANNFLSDARLAALENKLP